MLISFLLLVAVQTVLGQYDANCGGKTVIVHLFEWKWMDIAAECERFLAPNGYCGVQVSPPSEHLFIDGTYPWWQRYQPVSYKLFSRSGTEAQFIDMVSRCNAVGVRIYVDAVFNHMTGGDRAGTSPYANSTYDGGRLDFPGVPYDSTHFTPRNMCPSATGGVDNYQDARNVRNCYLVGLTDLYGASVDVQDKVAAYLNNLVDIGVAGIRVDAAKHMWPQDISDILAKVKPLPISQGFPPNSKLFVYQEVIDFNNEAVKSTEYFDNGYVMEFRYSRRMAEGIMDYSLLYNLVDTAWNMAPTNRAFVFVDNHDSQRDNLGVGDVITFKTPREYKQAVAYMLAHPYGLSMVMSSYNFTDRDAGPPGTNGVTADVIINPDGSCGGGWVCEHRWKSVANMASSLLVLAKIGTLTGDCKVANLFAKDQLILRKGCHSLYKTFAKEGLQVKFSNFASGRNMTNYWNSGIAVGFTRDGRCFFAMAQFGSLDRTCQTGLPEGTYCNLVDDCSTTVNVLADGSAQITINNVEEPMVAICIGGGTTLEPESTISTVSSTPPTTPTTQMPGDMKRTVVFMQKVSDGKEVFIRGGIDHIYKPSCTFDAATSECAIPISIRSLGTNLHYASYDAWSVGDTKLDWYGAQIGQGTFLGIPASGTPMVKTSNNPNDPGYQPLNVFGDDYWMVDMYMDCSKTVNQSGWFELRAFIGNDFETDIEQSAYCPGNAGGLVPFKSTHHIGRCGYLNLFYYESNSCEIEEINESTGPSTASTTSTAESTTLPTTESSTEATTASTTVATTTPTTEPTTTPTTEPTTEPTTTPTTTTVAPKTRTVIFLQKTTENGDFLFIKGGIEPTSPLRPECSTNPDKCTIPLSVRSLGTTPGFDGYNAWRIGDTKLDWGGAEPGQGSHVLGGVTIPPLGTPLVWSTNDDTNPLYQPLNTFGPYYWMVDMDMDCSATENGWFEFVGAFRSNTGSISTEELTPGQGSCTGNATIGIPPFNFGRHMALCGYMNVFLYGTGACQIYPLSN